MVVNTCSCTVKMKNLEIITIGKRYIEKISDIWECFQFNFLIDHT